MTPRVLDVQRFLILYCFEEPRKDSTTIYGYSSLWSRDLKNVVTKVDEHCKRNGLDTKATDIFMSNMLMPAPSISKWDDVTEAFKTTNQDTVPHVLRGIHKTNLEKRAPKKQRRSYNTSQGTSIINLVEATKDKPKEEPVARTRDHLLKAPKVKGIVKLFPQYTAKSYRNFLDTAEA